MPWDTGCPHTSQREPCSKCKEIESLKLKVKTMIGNTNTQRTEICLSIPIPAIGKPRMTQKDRWAKRPCVVAYRTWADELRAYVGPITIDVVEVSWCAWFAFPKSYSQTKRANLAGRPHRLKPDRDNVDKAILDALFDSDQMIAGGTIWKRWDDGNGERIELTLVGG